MPRYAAVADVSALPTAGNGRAGTCYPTDLIGDVPVAPPGKVILHRFDAPDLAAANVYFGDLLRNGCPADPDFVGKAGTDSVPDAPIWRFRGDGKYLVGRLKAFGLESSVLLRHIERDPHFRVVTDLLNELTGRYMRAQKENGVAAVSGPESQHVAATLARCAAEEAKLVVKAAAICDALDEAFRAFGVGHPRAYTVPSAPAPDGPAETIPAKPHRRPSAKAE